MTTKFNMIGAITLKITLIQPPNSELISRISVGLLSIGSFIKSHSNYEIQIVDLASYLKNGDIDINDDIYKNCAEFLLTNFDSDIIAFSTLVTNEIPAIQISKIIKQRKPNSIIIFGNQWATLNDYSILENFTFVDFIVRGEGEITFLELINCLEHNGDLAEINGITYRENTSIVKNSNRSLIQDINRIPDYDFSLLNPHYNLYSKSEFGGNYGILEFGRGCPYSCIFCSTSLFWNKCVRTFDVKRTIKDMQQLINKDFDFIEFTYDNFGTNREEIMYFCNEILKQEIKIKWSIRCRLDFLDYELVQYLKSSGCVSILVGVESGSENVVKKVGKKINFSLSLQNIYHLINAGIRVDASFITGLNFESINDINSTIKLASFLHSYGKLSDAEIHFVAPIPGTKFANEAIKSNNLKFSDNMIISPSFSSYLSWNSLIHKDNSDFANRVRFSQDQELIDNHPSLFCAYGYYENKCLNSEYFACVSTYVNKLIEFYPVSMFIIMSYFHEKELDFISSFNLFSKSNNYDTLSLIKHKVEVSDKFENGNKDKVLIDLFYNYFMNLDFSTEYEKEILNYERFVIEISSKINNYKSYLDNEHISITENSYLISNILCEEFSYNVLEVIEYIKKSYINNNKTTNLSSIQRKKHIIVSR